MSAFAQGEIMKIFLNAWFPNLLYVLENEFLRNTLFNFLDKGLFMYERRVEFFFFFLACARVSVKRDMTHEFLFLSTVVYRSQFYYNGKIT